MEKSFVLTVEFLMSNSTMLLDCICNYFTVYCCKRRLEAEVEYIVAYIVTWSWSGRRLVIFASK